MSRAALGHVVERVAREREVRLDGHVGHVRQLLDLTEHRGEVVGGDAARGVMQRAHLRVVGQRHGVTAEGLDQIAGDRVAAFGQREPGALQEAAGAEVFVGERQQRMHDSATRMRGEHVEAQRPA